MTTPSVRRPHQLVIVQNRETQFDALLYARISRDGCIDLTVSRSNSLNFNKTLISMK